MEQIEQVEALRARIAAWRQAGERIALVPTMGNLHAGHHALVRLAKTQARRVVVSIFVNPTQFGPNEDFARYPRTPQADAEGLRAIGCDLLFLPTVATMYPLGIEHCVKVHVPGLSDELDGAARPGHFDGVATVVLRLFNMVQPDMAVFGRKDFQQWRVLERLVRDLALPIDILPAPIQRADDGLALSSRNQYLSAHERSIAPLLYQSLIELRRDVAAGLALAEAERRACARLSAAGFVPDYVELRQVHDLRRPAPEQRTGLVALAAARLGQTRLIDNLEL